MKDTLKQSTAVVIQLGPFVDKTDGITLKTGLVSALDHASTGIMLSKNGGTLAVRHATVTASSYDAHGCYKVTLDTTDVGTLGTLRVIYTDATTCLPVWRDFTIVPAMVNDSLIAGTDDLDTNTKKWNDLTTVALPLVPATAGRTLVVDAAGLADANIVKGGPSGSGVATTANFFTRLQQIFDTDYGTVYDATNKRFNVALQQILATTLTETSTGYLAAAFKKLFDVATPTMTTASLPSALPDTLGGIGTTRGGRKVWFYDAVSGSDANSGLADNAAFQTISAVCAVAKAGHAVIVLSGSGTVSGDQIISTSGVRWFFQSGAIFTDSSVSTITVTGHENEFHNLTVRSTDAATGWPLDVRGTRDNKLFGGNIGSNNINLDAINIQGAIGFYAEGTLFTGPYDAIYGVGAIAKFVLCKFVLSGSYVTGSPPDYSTIVMDGISTIKFEDCVTVFTKAEGDVTTGDLSAFRINTSTPLQGSLRVVNHTVQVTVAEPDQICNIHLLKIMGSYPASAEIYGGNFSVSSNAAGTTVLAVKADNHVDSKVRLYGTGGPRTYSGDVRWEDGDLADIITDIANMQEDLVEDGVVLTVSERATLVAQVEAALVNDGDATALLQAIGDKIAADLTAGDLTALAIASAVRTNLATELARIDATISSRLATVGYTAPPSASTNASTLLAVTNGSASVAAQLQHLDQDVSDVSGGGGGSPTDENFEPVPDSRTFKLLPTSDEGLIAETAKSIMVGYRTTIAVDFAADLAANGFIRTVDDVILLADSGLTITNWGRQGTKALFRAEATSAGSYGIEVAATYFGGSGGRGRITLVVPEPQTEFTGGVPGSSAEVEWTDVDQEKVPADRTFVLVPTKDRGLVAEVVRSFFIGGPAIRIAIDFKNDLSANRGIATVTSIQLVDGDEEGAEIGETFGRDHTQAKGTWQGTTAGTYTYNCAVVYANGDGARGQITIKAVE